MHAYNHVTVYFFPLNTGEGYGIVSGAVDFCVDDVQDKCYCVIGDSVDLYAETKEHAQKQRVTLGTAPTH